MLGKLLMVTVMMTGWALFAGPTQAATKYTLVHAFTGSAADGAYPGSNLVAGKNGVVFGLALGVSDHSGQRTGTPHVFRLVPPSHAGLAWSYEDIHDFPSSRPVTLGDPLVADGSGALYGLLYGSIWRLSPPGPDQTTWQYTELYKFTDTGDGQSASSLTYFGGSLYGQSYGYDHNPNNCCAIVRNYRLSPPTSGHAAWTFEVLGPLHRFDGAGPPIVRLIDGRITLLSFGYRSDGGCLQAEPKGIRPADCEPPPFHVDLLSFSEPQAPGDGWTRHRLVSSMYDRYDDETFTAPLIADRADNISGVIGRGGDASHYTCGLAFRVSPPAAGGTKWSYSGLRHCDDKPGPVLPNGPLLNIDGVLYGVTLYGSVYKLTPTDLAGRNLPWNYASVYDFSGGSTQTFGNLVRVGTDPHQVSLLGLTFAEGSPNYGAIYQLDLTP